MEWCRWAAVWAFALALLLSLAGLSCSGVSGSLNSSGTLTISSADTAELTVSDVQAIVARTAAAADEPMVIAVTNRSGEILAVFRKPNAPVMATGNFSMMVGANELAVSLARTASFFSNDQAPLSSRTVRYISGIHFPPGIAFTPNAALYGIENTNRGCPLNAGFAPGQALPPARSIDGSGFGLGIATGKANEMDGDPFAVNPGGVPIFHNGHLVGGVGVVAAVPAVAEFAAFIGGLDPANGFGPHPAPPGVVVIDGISLPFVNQTTLPATSSPGTPAGSYMVGPIASPGPVPDGDLVVPRAGPLGGLSQAEVAGIVANAVATASVTRAVIRLPIGLRTRMAIAVVDLDGTILALHRMPDGTVFSVDVAVAKARNMAYFDSTARAASDLPGVPLGIAVTNRTIGFGAQPLFPPGIDGSGVGPFFPLYTNDTANPCTQGMQPPSANQNGVVFFPGSVGLYRNGVLVGGLGVSGDGVDQDDFVTAGGAGGFEAPAGIRADQISIRGVNLPYLKFPRNPTD